MSSLFINARQVMDTVAPLMNDPAKTDYTYATMIPYLNIAIGELNEAMEEANVGVTNDVSPVYVVRAGVNILTNPPHDMIEIQELGERAYGSSDSFIQLPRREFPDSLPASGSLLFWCWKRSEIVFNQKGATTDREVQLKYTRRPFWGAQNELSIIGNVSSHMFLTFKTAALCAQFVGENESRAAVLQAQADHALERIIGISNKGKQQMMTRHRPFRAGYKSRGY
jgi:hypothetical protein